MKEFALKIINTSGTPTVFSAPEKASSLNNLDAQSLVSTAVSFLLFFVAILTLFFLIWGGIDLILAQGEKQQVTNARQKLTFAVIGLVVVLASFLIVGTVGSIFGVNFFGR